LWATKKTILDMSFSIITKDLQAFLKSNLPQIRFLLKKNPAMGYTRITELGKEIGKKYNMKLIVNFPKEGKIEEFDMYGKRDLSLIMDLQKTNFPIERSIIKEKAAQFFPDSKIRDAYMYEGKEGVKVFLKDGRIDILPHSLHIWCEFTEKVTQYCDWLLENVYERN